MKRNGFTLIEITIALLIMGLFLHLLIANWSGILSESRLESQAKMIKAFIEFAREEAVNKCIKIELIFKENEVKAIKSGGNEDTIKSITLEGASFKMEGEERVYIDELGKISGKIPLLFYEGKSIEFKIVNPILGIVSYEIK
ncbi:MAG: prepilin-type N-terminal cleavage/methylation domain-containing protein [Synergistetes bacterium]|nr:prepilin-type N-terminal cleavage/methylation domain-containing protein [Synergistota bacterium]MDW8191611.1 prepilin-type N-terminal cleavage/methylation domain-containing protein [Synergistota bacterium]